MNPNGARYGKVRRSYLINMMRLFYNGQVNTQKIIRLEKINKKSLEQKAINPDKDSSQ